jgi:hypothetical protein
MQNVVADSLPRVDWIVADEYGCSAGRLIRMKILH